MAMVSVVRLLRTKLKTKVNETTYPSGMQLVRDLEQELKQLNIDKKTFKPVLSETERKTVRDMTKIFLFRAKSEKVQSIQNFFYKL